MREPVIVTDGGPWAMHDMPCSVCRQRNAEARHEEHRTSMAVKALRADAPAPTEMQQVAE